MVARHFIRIFSKIYFIPMYLLGGLLVGLALWPEYVLMRWVFSLAIQPALLKDFLVVFAAGCSYFLFGISLVLVIALYKNITFLKSKETDAPIYSMATLSWVMHNGLLLLAKYLFLGLTRSTPINVFFYRLMGMKVGKNVIINTTIVHDVDLIEIGDNTVIGGDAAILGHIGEGNRLIRKRVKIGKGVTIGQYATISCGVEIGDNSVIGAHTFIPKDRKIPPNEVWAGIPARRLRSLTLPAEPASQRREKSA